MTTFKQGSSLQREIRIAGIDKPVSVRITAQGLEFWVKGSRKRVTTTWLRAVQSGSTTTDVPSFLMGSPVELLQYQAAKTTR